MPLEAIGPMMRRAALEGYAVGYFESWNLESLQGVVDAAEESDSPIILGFNGAFLAGDRAAPEGLEVYAAMGRAAYEAGARNNSWQDYGDRLIAEYERRIHAGRSR